MLMTNRRRGPNPENNQREQVIQQLMGFVRDWRRKGESFSYAMNKALDPFADVCSGQARHEMRRELGRRFGAFNDANQLRDSDTSSQSPRSKQDWLIDEARKHWREIGLPEEYEQLDDNFN